MSRFVNLKGSSTVHKRVRLAYYVVPIFVTTGIAISHYISISFGIYLKYQALVDGYYEKSVSDKYSGMMEDTDSQNANKVNHSKNQNILGQLPPLGMPSKAQ